MTDTNRSTHRASSLRSSSNDGSARTSKMHIIHLDTPSHGGVSSDDKITTASSSAQSDHDTDHLQRHSVNDSADTQSEAVSSTVRKSHSTASSVRKRAHKKHSVSLPAMKRNKQRNSKSSAQASSYKEQFEAQARRKTLLTRVGLGAAAVVIIILILILALNLGKINNVSNLTIESTASTQTLKWSGASKNLTYEIYRAEGEGNQYQLIDTLTGGENGITYDGLQAGTLYRYQIVTVKNSSHKTDGAFIEAYTKPNQVTGISAASAGQNSLTVTWSQNGLATNYEIKFGLYENLRDAQAVVFQYSDASYDSSTGIYSYTLTDLASDQTYYLSIKVVAGDNTTDWSAVFEGTVTDAVEMTSVDTTKPMVALTFDGGPDGDGYTEEILDLLKEYGGYATFFQTGEHASEYPDLIKRMVDEGHELGNHTYDESHVGSEVTAEDITDANTAIKEAGGVKPLLFRAPQGEVTDDIIDTCTDEEMSIVLWSLDSYDWSTYDSNEIVETVENNVADGDIIQFRNIYEETADAMAEIIPYLVEEGYQLVTVSQLIQAGTGEAPEAGTIYYSATNNE